MSIIRFPDPTPGRIAAAYSPEHCDQVLEQAKGKLDQVLVLGIRRDDETLYMDANPELTAMLIAWMLGQASHTLFCGRWSEHLPPEGRAD